MQTINSMDKQQTIEKPKRKQVKNACGKILFFFSISLLTLYNSQLSKGMQEM
jgi:hypothetical protein